MKVSVSNVAVGLLLLFGGYALGQDTGPVQTITVPDTVTAKAYAAELRSLRLERDGLRSRLEGVREVVPQVVLITDTVIRPDTVLRFVTVKDGSLTFERLTTIDMPDVAYEPALLKDHDISRCDEGYAIDSTGAVLCDPAQFGHLYVGPHVGTTTYLGMWWTPSYRSPWDVTIGFTGSEWFAGIRRGVRLW